jgi:quinol-cytochrome oxidoreductase complex cytochrome b subunit
LHNHSREKDDKVRFFPNVLLAEMSLAIAVIGLLAVFVSLFPLKLGEKFDPLNPPSILEPEWYFMGFYQFLKTQDVTPFYGIILMAGVAIFIVLIPFLDRGEERRPLRRPIFMAAAFLMVTEFLGLTIYGYLSPGQTGSFSSLKFTTAFIIVNSIAVLLIILVFAANRRIKRGTSQ